MALNIALLDMLCSKTSLPNFAFRPYGLRQIEQRLLLRLGYSAGDLLIILMLYNSGRMHASGASWVWWTNILLWHAAEVTKLNTASLAKHWAEAYHVVMLVAEWRPSAGPICWIHVVMWSIQHRLSRACPRRSWGSLPHSLPDRADRCQIEAAIPKHQKQHQWRVMSTDYDVYNATIWIGFAQEFESDVWIIGPSSSTHSLPPSFQQHCIACSLKLRIHQM